MSENVSKKAGKDRSNKGLISEEGGGVRKNKVRFTSLGSVRRFLARILNDLDADKIPESKARTLGYLCSIMRDLIRDADLESRILKLEKLMEEKEDQ